eukprot:scaffold30615_cov64-Phaeocystis_antarctica.AAC.5
MGWSQTRLVGCSCWVTAGARSEGPLSTAKTSWLPRCASTLTRRLSSGVRVVLVPRSMRGRHVAVRNSPVTHTAVDIPERIVWRKRRSWLDTAKRPRCSEQRRAAQPVESDSLARSKAALPAASRASRLVGRRRTQHAACSAALRRRARPLARATPTTYEDVSGGARTTSRVVRRTSVCARSAR